jgi:hypothetical protein
MTDRELNEALAKALGWEVVDHEMFTPDPCELWLDLKTGYPVCAVSDFSPATSVDALRKWVLPELDRRGLAQAFMDSCFQADDALQLEDDEDTYGWWLLTATPSTLAAAALAVMEADNA